ncbi:olfactory receptor 6M1-like [Python bivittatus]|uniref:Olfactory receptor n=1 Tax=Python bivittatus TaxID=176946 RepID=A0A9F2R8F7_PYTBI|nr:olfactory receptor 6M1-like [Python bivittatus]
MPELPQPESQINSLDAWFAQIDETRRAAHAALQRAKADYKKHADCKRLPEEKWKVGDQVDMWKDLEISHLERRNATSITEFILIGFPNPWKIQILLFLLFFLMLVATMIGNTLIIILVLTDYRLQSPMYFFLCNLSIIEILITLTVVPKMLQSFLLEQKKISFSGCFIQSYFYFLFGTSEYVLLAMMSYDRYVAICYPLHYTTIMSGKVCISLVLASWMSGFFSILIPTVMKVGLPYCGPNVINHFFCDSAPLLHLACADIHLVEFIDFLVSLPIILGSLLLTSISYIYIVSTILHIPSATGRQRAFSTCASHFTVVSIGYGTSIFIYVRPSQTSSMNLNKIASLITTAITPLLNPIIFTFRNQKVQEVFKDFIHKLTDTSKQLD